MLLLLLRSANKVSDSDEETDEETELASVPLGICVGSLTIDSDGDIPSIFVFQSGFDIILLCFGLCRLQPAYS